MKKLLATLCLSAILSVSFCLGSSPAHSETWSKTYGVTSGANNATTKSVDVVGNNGYIMVGKGYQNNLSQITRTDKKGNIIWQKRYDGSVTAPSELNSILATTDGGFIAAGTIYSFKAFVWVLRGNPDGSILWQKTFDSNADDQKSIGSRANLIKSTKAGDGYIIGGLNSSPVTGSKDALLIKIDLNGNIFWQNSYSPSNYSNDEILDLYETASGDIIVAGVGSGVTNSSGWVAKMSPTGVLLWEGGISSTIHADSILEDSNGDILVTGSALTGPFVAKLDTNSSLLWFKTYPESSGTSRFSSISKTRGGFIIAGAATPPSLSLSSGRIIKIDSSGNIIDKKIFGQATGSNIFSSIEDIKFTPADGGSIAVGTRPSSITLNNSWALKIDKAGNIPSCNLQLPSTATAVDNPNVTLISSSASEFDPGLFTSTPTNTAQTTNWLTFQQCP